MIRVLTTILLLPLYYNLLSIDDSRFPIHPTAEWRIHYEVMDDDTIQQDGDEFYTIFIEGDTLIGANQYYKVYKSGHAYYNPVFSFDHVYVGAVRDESNIYYYIEKGNTDEEILYDFDLDIGDTIKSVIEKGMKVNTIETLNSGRRKISFTKTDFQHGECMNLMNTYLIEGIGSMGGFFYESPCNHVGFREHCLVCYYEDGLIIYNNQLSVKNCDSKVNTTNRSSMNTDIRLYPVPTHKILSIKLNDWLIKPINIKIVDLLGKTVYSETALPFDNKIELDMGGLHKGIYMIRMYNSDAYFSKQFIID